MGLVRHFQWMVAVFFFTSTICAQPPFNQFYIIDNLLSRELIKSVAKDGEGYVWIATDDGVLRYDGFQTHVFYRELPSVYTKGFLMRENGQFCVLSDFGLSEIIHHNDSVYFKPFQIGDQTFNQPLNYPKSVYEDRQGNVWVGEHNALVRMNESGFRRFELGEDFRSIDYHRTFSFAEDAFGTLWIAPFKGPLLYFDKDQEELITVPLQIPPQQYRAIASVKGDHLVVGSNYGVLTLKVDSDHNVLNQSFRDQVGNVSSIVVLNDRDVFLGTRTSGLYYYDFDRPEDTFEHLSNVPIANIVDLYLDPARQELWITGDENMGLIKPSVVSTVSSIGQNRIESLAVDAKNNLYYSTGER